MSVGSQEHPEPEREESIIEQGLENNVPVYDENTPGDSMLGPSVELNEAEQQQLFELLTEGSSEVPKYVQWDFHSAGLRFLIQKRVMDGLPLFDEDWIDDLSSCRNTCVDSFQATVQWLCDQDEDEAVIANWIGNLLLEDSYKWHAMYVGLVLNPNSRAMSTINVSALEGVFTQAFESEGSEQTVDIITSTYSGFLTVAYENFIMLHQEDMQMVEQREREARLEEILAEQSAKIEEIQQALWAIAQKLGIVSDTPKDDDEDI